MKTRETVAAASRASAGPAGRCRETRVARRSVAAFAAASAVLLAGACGGADADPAPAPAPAAGAPDMASLPEATTFGNLATAAVDPQPESPTDGEVIHPKSEVAVHAEAGGAAIAKLPTEQIGSPTWVPVIAREGDWAQILLPTRPNAAAGWVDTAGGKFETATNDYVVNVDVDGYSLEIVQAGESRGEWTIGVGKPEHPTPKGRAFILASIEETVNTYSPIVLPLSSHSDSHETFGGGPGTVGIHTWPDESFVGKSDSDGCIRVTKEALDKLVELPLGTIVNIT